VRRAGVVIALCTACSFTGSSSPDAPPTAGDAPGLADLAPDPDGDPPPSDWLPGYQKRKAIHLAAPLAPLTDVPLAVITRGAPDFNGAHLDGDDLVVTASDGVTPLPFELVAFARAAGDLELWVRLATFDAATTVYLYFDGPPAPRAGAWPPGYAGVWHLGDVAIARDSAAGVDLLPAIPSAAPTATAMAPTIAAYDYASGDCMRTEDAASESLDFATTSFSYAAWVRVTSSVGEYDAPIWNGGTSSGEPGYTMLLGHNLWHAKLHDGQQYVDASFGTETQLANRWVHLAVVVDRPAATMRTYVDGVMTDSAGITAIDSLQNTHRFSLGLTTDGPYRGQLDEVRVYDGIVDPARFALERRNLTDPTFVVVDPVELR